VLLGNAQTSDREFRIAPACGGLIPVGHECGHLAHPGVREELREKSLDVPRRAALPFAEAASGNTYRTTSLYFDTAASDVFHQRGSYGRAKYRIRRYGSENSVFLERKLRTNGMVSKRRTPVPIDDLPRLGSTSDPAWAGFWFERRIAARAMAPVCQIRYRRTALMGGNDSGQIRLTIDDDVRAAEIDGPAFCPEKEGVPLLQGEAILEMKFRLAMPVVFKQLLQEFRLGPQSVSKYRLAVPVLAAAKEMAAACA